MSQYSFTIHSQVDKLLSVNVHFQMPVKKAVVTPLKRKAVLTGNALINYHPVSGFCFQFQLVEQVVAKPLMPHINSNKLDNIQQSDYKPGRSMETVLLSIKNEV